MDFLPYKINEILENKYYQIPQELFTNEKYKDKLNSDSKILYAFLLDRLTLSQKNHWIDEENSVYLIFTREEVQYKLGLSDKTVTKAFKQLAEVNLVSEKRQGLGKPNIIYVGKIKHEEIPEPENVRFLNRKNYDSGNVNSTTLESENLRGINTNNIKPNITNLKSINPNSDDSDLTALKIKCRLNEFSAEEQSILEPVIDALYYKETLKVGNVTINHLKILEKLQLIEKENLIVLLNTLKNTNNIKNVTNYLMICLFNNLGNTHFSVSSPSLAGGEEKDYAKTSWDDLYDNDYYDAAIESS